MTNYYLDTNVILRFLLRDNDILHKKSEKIFLEAEKGKSKIIITPSVIFEIVYVLEKVYKIKREKISKLLDFLLNKKVLNYIDEKFQSNNLWLMRR